MSVRAVCVGKDVRASGQRVIEAERDGGARVVADRVADLEVGVARNVGASERALRALQRCTRGHAYDQQAQERNRRRKKVARDVRGGAHEVVMLTALRHTLPLSTLIVMLLLPPYE